MTARSTSTPTSSAGWSPRSSPGWAGCRSAYYAQTNPGFVALAKRTVEEVLADLGSR
jgi:hypothetical protein